MEKKYVVIEKDGKYTWYPVYDEETNLINEIKMFIVTIKDAKNVFWDFSLGVLKAIVVSVFFAILWIVGTALCLAEITTAIAFVALVTSVVMGPLSFLIKDDPEKLMAAWLASTAIGFVANAIYFYFCNYFEGTVFSVSNIGNTITTITLCLLLGSSLYDMFKTYLYKTKLY